MWKFEDFIRNDLLQKSLISWLDIKYVACKCYSLFLLNDPDIYYIFIRKILIGFFSMGHAEVFHCFLSYFSFLFFCCPRNIFPYLQVAQFYCYRWLCSDKCPAMNAKSVKVAKLIKFIAASNLLRFVVRPFWCLFLLQSLTIFWTDTHSFL